MEYSTKVFVNKNPGFAEIKDMVQFDKDKQNKKLESISVICWNPIEFEWL